MIESDRRKLCADLRDPWAVTIEELAELAATAADEIEKLAQEIELLQVTAAESLGP